MNNFDQQTSKLLSKTMYDTTLSAMRLIRSKRFEGFSAQAKGLKANGDTDWMTSVDLEVQLACVSALKNAFPRFGIVAEEQDLCVPCQIPGHNIFFSVDPIDGTTAFKNRQSDSFSFMLSLTSDGVVIAVSIGNPMTDEIFFFSPGNENVLRFDTHPEMEGRFQTLGLDPEQPLASQSVLIRCPVTDLRSQLIVERMLGREKPLFKTHQINRGSVGVTSAKVWIAEMGATIFSGRKSTPWDDNPFIGICIKLGIIGFILHPSGSIQAVPLVPRERPVDQPHDVMIAHVSRIDEIKAWCQAHQIRFENYLD